MNKKVIYAKLQTEAHVPSAGGLGTVFPPQSKTLEHLSMTALESVLSISFTYRGVKKELLVPYGNVVLMEVAPSDSDRPPLYQVLNTPSVN